MRIPAMTLTLTLLLAAGCSAGTDPTPAPAPEPAAATPATTSPDPAATPADIPAPPDADDPTTGVPVRFQGDYAANAAACTTAGHVSHLSVTATRIEFHESSGGITSAEATGNDIEITARVTGEGETRDVGYSFALSDDGGTLTDTVNGMARVRCGDEASSVAAQ